MKVRLTIEVSIPDDLKDHAGAGWVLARMVHAAAINGINSVPAKTGAIPTGSTVKVLGYGKKWQGLTEMSFGTKAS